MELQAVSVLVEGLRQERKQVGRLGGLVTGFGAIVAISSFKVKDGTQATIMVCGWVALAFGLLIVARSRRPAESDVTLRRLVAQPQDLVWFYVKEIRRSSTGSISHLWLHFLDGSRKGVALPPLREGPAANELRVLCPQAREGYSPEREAAFRRDPRTIG